MPMITVRAKVCPKPRWWARTGIHRSTSRQPSGSPRGRAPRSTGTRNAESRAGVASLSVALEGVGPAEMVRADDDGATICHYNCCHQAVLGTRRNIRTWPAMVISGRPLGLDISPRKLHRSPGTINYQVNPGRHQTGCDAPRWEAEIGRDHQTLLIGRRRLDTLHGAMWDSRRQGASPHITDSPCAQGRAGRRFRGILIQSTYTDGLN